MEFNSVVQIKEDDEGIHVYISDKMSRAVVVAFITALLGGIGTTGYNLLHDPRPDPWTRTQAEQAHKEIWEWIKAHEEYRNKTQLELERRLSRLEAHND